MSYRNPKNPDGTEKQWVINKRKAWRAKYRADPEADWRRRLMPKYGITPEQWDEMYRQQQGCCAGCGKHQSKLSRRLNTDHCHTTGTVRGLLCNECNRAIGLVYDKPETLRRLADYLDTGNQTA